MKLSIVIPCYNESASIEALLNRTKAVLQNCDFLYEILVIDNGSSDGEFLTLKRLCVTPSEKIIRLSRNFGYQGALWAGLDHAQGDAVVFMDADGEDPPEMIPQFLEKWKEGYDVVYGVRKSRQVPWWLSRLYKIFYRVLAAQSQIDIPLDAGEFSLVSGPALQAMRRFQDRTRMLRIIRAWVGYRQIGVPYEREARLAGKSKFGFLSSISFAFDGFTSATDLPVRMAIYCAFLCMGLGVLGTGYYLAWHFLGSEKIPGFASLNITILFLFSMLFLCVAVLSRYVITLLDETRRRPPYLVRD